VRFSPCRLDRRRRLPSSASSSASSSPVRLLVAGASNFIQCYTLTDRTTNDNTTNDDVLDASPLNVSCTECLVSSEDYQSISTAASTTAANNTISLGYAALDIVRNYCGEDTIAGDEVVIASRLGGQVCIWVRGEKNDDVSTTLHEDDTNTADASGGDKRTTRYIRPNVEFVVNSATGTTLAIRPPSLANYYNICEGNDDILVALGCADGAVVLCKTSVLSARPGGKRIDGSGSGGDADILSKSTTPPGKIVASVGSGHACVLSLRFHPTCPNSFVVGRKDGTVDIYSSPLSTSSSSSSSGELTFRRMHHLLHASSPVRALSFSCPDGALLFAADDDGHLYSYDASCNNERTNMSAPVKLVACAITAHKGWVMDVTPFPDGRHLVTCGSDRSVKVWDCSSGLASSKPVHTFEGMHEGIVWGVDCGRADVDGSGGTIGGRASGTNNRLKLASCGNDGVVQIFSCGE
jgi:WD40 repeat protein